MLNVCLLATELPHLIAKQNSVCSAPIWAWLYHCFAGCGKPCGSMIDAALFYFLNPLNYHSMKRLFLFAALCASLLSCSGDDASSTSNISSINPPTWTHGTWTMAAGGVTTIGLKFTSNDVCTINASTTSCNKQMIDAFSSGGGHTDVEEEISDTEYNVDITIGTTTTNYHVQKVSTTQMKWFANGSTSVTLTKQ